MVRQPAVAGSFYPGSRPQLEAMLQQLVPDGAVAEPVLAAMLPHAGYIYSGRIAAETLSRVRIPRQVVLLGPNHHGRGAGFAVSPAEAWETPLGNCQLDAALAEQLVASIPLAEFDESAHRDEHSLEVLLPLLQWLNPAARIVPICIRSSALEALLEFGDALAEYLKSANQDVLLIASSDMSHFLTAGQAREQDFMAIECILKLAPGQLYRTVRQQRISMCGVAPCVSLLQASLGLGAASAELVRYGTSADRTGDSSNVVGYAGMLIS